MKKIFSILIALLIPIIIILFNLNLFFFTSLTPELSNFMIKGTELSEEFTEKEKIHMQEVKDLVNISLLILITSIIILTILISKFKKKTIKSIIYGGIISISLPLLIILFSIINFDLLFHLFHKTFFRTNNYLLNPTDLLIKTYPFQFFYNTTIKLLLSIIIESIALIILVKRIK